MSRDAGILVTVVLALLLIGLVMLYSATAVVAENSTRLSGGDTHFLLRQLVWVALGLGAMALTSKIPYTFWERWRVPILVGTVVLLALVFVPGIGARLNGSRRWIRAGGFFLQPSEVAKMGVAIFLCGFAAADPDRLRKFFTGFVPAFAVLGGVCALVVVEPDIGTTLFIATVMSLTLFVAGVRWGHILPMFLLAVVGIGYYGLTHTEHVMERVKNWLHPELDPMGKGLQILQSLSALEGGQMWGMGLGRGTSKLYFLPEAHSDFIFAVAGEELGFVGSCVVVLLYVTLGWTGYRIMRRAPDRFSFLLAFAVTTYIILQAAINVAVVTKAVPTKGIPLPLVSAGGSSALITLAALGILVRIANAAEERGLCSEKAHSASCSPAEAPGAMSSPASPSPSTP